MLDEKAIAAASKTLHDHWRAGTKFAGLDDGLRPHDRIDGYAIQAEIEKYSSESLFGWKIAATSEAGQKHINVDGPMAGRILAETVISRWRDGFDGGQRNARRRTRIRLSHARRSAGACHALYSAAGPRRGRHAASGHRDSGFAVRRLRQRRRRADHCRQRLRASVRAGAGRQRADWRSLRPGRGATCHHDARPAIYRSRQERAGRSTDRTDLARQ